MLLVSLIHCLAWETAAADPQRKLEAARKALDAGDHGAAAKDLAEGLEEAREDGAHANVVMMLCLELGELYATYPDLGHEAEAEKLLLEARRIAESETTAGSNARIATLQKLGTYYAVSGRNEQAIPVLEQFLKEGETAVRPEQLYVSQEATMLREAYSAVGNSEGAARLRKLAEDPTAQRTQAPVALIPHERLYLEPNARDASGAPIFLHFDPALVPLRVSVALPETPASDGSAEQTRDAAIAGMREWETAIRRIRPDFRLDFGRDDAGAPIQVTWSDRPPGYSGGSGTVEAVVVDGVTRTEGRVILAAKPLPGRGETLSLAAVYTHAVHAFGGALGLGYCQQCDSVRSMGWMLRDGAARPTDVDLRTLEALLAKPNGERAGEAERKHGVLADLPFVNTGDDRHIYLDIAKPGAAPFVVQLDTGAAETVMTPVYARALGVATRAVKSDEHRRDTVTGKPVLFWVTDQFDGARDSRWSYALLGGSYLESYVVEIDVPRRRVRLLDPALHQVGGAEPRAGEHAVPMTVTHGWPLVEVALGTGTTVALVDTGATGSVIISEEAAARLGIAVDPNAPRRQWQNVLGTSRASVQRVPSLGIGSATLADVEIDIGLRDSGVRIERMILQNETLLGLEVLRRFVLRIDYPRKRLGLTPVGTSDAAADARERP